MTGDLDLAEHRLAEASKQFPDGPLIISLQGLLHARRNQRELVWQVCEPGAGDSARSFGHTHHTYYQIACVYAVLRETRFAQYGVNARDLIVGVMVSAEGTRGIQRPAHTP